jgi:carboxymethylenebutenolidase
MRVTYETVDVPTPDGARFRCAVHAPVAAAPARRPGVVAFSDIFQLTATHLRICARLASHGFVVVSPEIFGRVLPAGRALDFDADRQLALDTTERMTVDTFDADRRAVLAWMRAHPAIDAARLVACGWCIGGHLAFRAAQEPVIRATACFYPTGLHADTVGGAHGTATSLAGAAAIQGSLLLVWGARDPHIPKDGRAHVHRALAEAGIDFHVRIYDAEHTFMRDEGPRCDPELARLCYGMTVDLFRRRLGS